MKSLFLLFTLPLMAAEVRNDITVYGSTPAGIASAVVAAREGKQVLLVEPTKHFGGLLTGGLSNTDFRTLEAVTGFYRDYMDRALAYYEKKYGRNSKQAHDCFFGALTEPHVSDLILRQMMAEQPTLKLWMDTKLTSVKRKGTTIETAQIGGQTVRASVWIDATYEGDLAAMAKVQYRTDRESTAEYGERFAGIIYFDQGRILPGSTGDADPNIQCMNFRIIMTNRPEIRVPVSKPPGYNREEFTKIIPYYRSGQLKEIYTEDHSGIIRLTHITNGKADMNDIKQAVVRFSLPGENNAWPDGSWEDRQKIYDRHLAYDYGLLYFLANDPELPEETRAKAREWGLAKDEFVNNNHISPPLYVREGRRILGDYLFKQQDTETAPRSVRAKAQPEAIASGDYSLNSHGHQAAGPLYPNLVEGDFGYSTTPFMIPYGVIRPREVTNLLVPVAISATHVGYSALRLEPTWTSMGHAAGLAASMALSHGNNVKNVPLEKLQAKLHQQGQATSYTSDIERKSPLFVPVQWAGLRGLLSDIVPFETAVMAPLKRRFGTQYSFAHANHAVEPQQKLDARLETLWKKRLPCAAQVNASTRGEFLQKAYDACQAKSR
jgi:hypothetical protein